MWDGNPGIAHGSFDTDHQFGQVDGGWIDWAREDDVNDLGEVCADQLAGKDLDIYWVDGRSQCVVDEQRLDGRYSQVEIAGMEAPAVAGGHALASGILDDIDGQRSIEAEQQDLVLDVGWK